jgi:hypothetical protein
VVDHRHTKKVHVKVKEGLGEPLLKVIQAVLMAAAVLLVALMAQLAQSELYTLELYDNFQAQERQMNNGTTLYKNRRE